MGESAVRAPEENSGSETHQDDEGRHACIDRQEAAIAVQPRHAVDGERADAEVEHELDAVAGAAPALSRGQTPHKERFANVVRENVRLEIRQPRAIETGTTAVPVVLPASSSSAQAKAKRFGKTHWLLWQVQALPPTPSEFRVQWARYSHIKAIVRQEGMKPDMLIAALARLRRGERAVVGLWQDRPIALLWLCRDPALEVASQGFKFDLPPGAALTRDSYLASDVQGSPRRETLMPALQTFLAAEGMTSLYGITAPGEREPLPARCGGTVQPVARRTEVGLCFGRFSYQRSQ